MRLIKTVLPIAALAAAIFILYTQFFSGSKTDENPVADSESVAPVQDNPEPDAPNAENTAVSPAGIGPSVSVAPPSANESSNELDSASSEQSQQQNYPDLAGYEVGVNDISEDAFLELVDRLRNDSVLMADVLNELRAETDPARLKRLRILLGATGSADVLPVAEELVYSSSIESRETGLDLLSRVAPQNPAAYDIANSILGSEADPDVLVSTMNVLARPQNAGPEAKATAISQIMPLANHESAAVRRHSVSLLVRLTNDETLSPVLYSALSDSDASVRKAATYAYASYPFQTSESVERLMEMIEDPSEERGIRQGAILAINNMSPDENTTERINAAKRQMRDALQTQ